LNAAVFRRRVAKKERERKNSPPWLFFCKVRRGRASTRCADGRQRATVEGIKCGGGVSHLLPERAGRIDGARRQAAGAEHEGGAQQHVRRRDGRTDRVRSKDGASCDVQFGSDELVGEDEARITTTWWRLQDRKQLRHGVGLAPYSETGYAVPSSRMILPESLSERAVIGISRIRG